METRTAARPYAEAAFTAAERRGQLARWSQALAVLAAVAKDARIAEIERDPSVGRERLTKLLLDIAGSDLDAEAQNFVRLVIDNHRLPLLPEIAELFEERRADAEGRIEVTVKTAFPLDSAQREQLEAGLKRRFGRKIEMTVDVDPSLIGGVEIRAGDTVIDGSAKGRLQQLAMQLNQP